MFCVSRHYILKLHAWLYTGDTCAFSVCTCCLERGLHARIRPNAHSLLPLSRCCVPGTSLAQLCRWTLMETGFWASFFVTCSSLKSNYVSGSITCMCSYCSTSSLSLISACPCFSYTVCQSNSPHCAHSVHLTATFVTKSSKRQLIFTAFWLVFQPLLNMPYIYGFNIVS